MAFELPEAMTVAQQMHGALSGKRIAEVHLSPACASLIRQGFINLHQVSLANLAVEAVTSKGKWIYVELDADLYLVLALETGGKFLYHRDQVAPPRFHVKLDLSDGSALTEHIVGWGWAKALKEDELELHRYPGKPGLPPVDDRQFTRESFGRVLAERAKQPIKAVLLEQSQIAGIGNGYAQDIFFRAGIHPARKAGDLTESEKWALHQAIREILSEAVQLGGSEFEVDLYGQPGRYKRLMGEHRKGQPCPNCGTLIEKLTIRGTSSYVCPACQR